MNRRGTGAIFCLISAILYSTRYISAAIFGSNLSSWDEQLFFNMLSYVGGTLTTLSIISLVIGVGYLILAEKNNE
ncbi:hypothetical protein [Romboutsia lituseburensis]|uniref:hypothetical protein n=1 Tax=Romboutsia lituseburensis TaxID=1537 RepID=UPI00215B1336|nr:hypothetical protein [Romboutsia lituseburensis]MCR8744228.1 hypothetical protein [Romboutsia lituseburensis]